MKKLMSVIMCLVLFCTAFIPCFAAENVLREDFDDGTYITVSIDDIKNENAMSIFSRIFEFFKKLIEFFMGQKTVSKTKYVNYYSADGELLWSAYLEADFVYSKEEAVCSDASFSCEIYDSDWKLISSECNKAENTASAEFFVKQYKLGVPLKSIERVLTLTCDTEGNVE